MYIIFVALARLIDFEIGWVVQKLYRLIEFFCETVGQPIFLWGYNRTQSGPTGHSKTAYLGHPSANGEVAISQARTNSTFFIIFILVTFAAVPRCRSVRTAIPFCAHGLSSVATVLGDIRMRNREI